MRPRKPRGFTLVELMVSIVIVAALASLIFLFAKRGIESAKAAECMSNMRQIQTSVTALTEDGVRTSHNPKRSYPPYAGQQQGPWNKFVWHDLAAEQMGLAEAVGGKYVWNTHPKETIFQNPLSERSFGGTGDEWKVLAGNKSISFGSYTWNNQMGDWVAAHSPTPLVRRAADVPYPATTIIFGESNDKLTGGGWPTACWSADTAPKGNYKNGAHCMFVDGHAELIPNNHLDTSEWYAHYMGVSPKARSGQIRKLISPPNK